MPKKSVPDKSVRIAAVTLNPKYGDIQANKDAIIEWLEQAASRTAKLVVFPEGILSGYDLDIKQQSALAMNDDAIEEIAERAELLGTVACFGFIERDAGQYYVSQAFVGEGLRLCYRKCHLTGWEKEHCSAGNILPVQDLGALQTGCLICYDSAFPQASQYLATQGAQLLISPTSNGMWMKDLPTGGKEEVLQQRLELVHCYWRARSFDNSVYSLYVEPVGETSKGEFHCGYAAIFGPDGKCLIERRNMKEGMISAEIYPDQLVQMRKQGVGHYNCIQDARPELYGAS